MNKHRIISRLFPAFLAAVMCITCLCSCTVFNPDRIVEYYFVSCTTPNNVLNLKGYYQFDEALELAHEIEAIPDPVSTEGVAWRSRKINTPQMPQETLQPRSRPVS